MILSGRWIHYITTRMKSRYKYYRVRQEKTFVRYIRRFGIRNAYRIVSADICRCSNVSKSFHRRSILSIIISFN